MLSLALDLEQAYAVLLLLGDLHDLQILVVHLRGSHPVEIQGSLLGGLAPQLQQPVHLVQQANLFQLVYLCPVPRLM